MASLLTAVLLPRMEYLTSIVASLLLRGRPATPRTLTRRSDTTLLERLLTCWLSVCLYEELREGGPAGRLLLLVRALHRLTERGPVDALTGAARYSLAESTLLKEQVDYKTVVSSGGRRGGVDGSGAQERFWTEGSEQVRWWRRREKTVLRKLTY